MQGYGVAACAFMVGLLVLAGMLYASGQLGHQWQGTCPEAPPTSAPAYVEEEKETTASVACCSSAEQHEHETLLEKERYHQRTFPTRLHKHGPQDFFRWWFRPTWFVSIVAGFLRCADHTHTRRCDSLELVGQSHNGDGPKWTCTEGLDAAHSANDCLIYSAGIDGDVSFEVGIKQRYLFLF